MAKAFNSFPEVGNRILLLLSYAEKSMSLDQVTILDLLSTFGKNYGIGESNLHGDNVSSSMEITTRRRNVQTSLANLASMGLVKIVVSREGFKYSIEDTGRRLASIADDEYANGYRACVRKVIKRYSKVDERELHRVFAALTKEVFENVKNGN